MCVYDIYKYTYICTMYMCVAYFTERYYEHHVHGLVSLPGQIDHCHCQLGANVQVVEIERCLSQS